MNDSGPHRGSAAVDRSRASAKTEMAAGTPPDTDPRSGPDLVVPEGTLADWVEMLAAERGDDAAIVEQRDGRSHTLTYGQLASDARQVADMLRDRGVDPGSRVGVDVTTTATTARATLFVAVQFAGGVYVPVGTDAGPGSEFRRKIDPTCILDPGQRAAAERERTDDTIPLSVGADGRITVSARDAERSLPGPDRSPDDVAAIVPTAGTTGAPALPALTHRNLLAGATMLDTRLSFGEDDVLAAVVPPTHALASVAPLACWAGGGTLADASAADLLADLRHAKPTRLLTVPRLCRQLYATLERMQLESGTVLGRLLAWADDVAREYGGALGSDAEPEYSLRVTHAVADRLVFATLRRRLGLQRVEQIVAAGGPIDPDLQTVFRGLGVPVLSGYGTGETTGVAALPAPEAAADGTVGAPLPGCTIRLADDGAVLVGGPQVIDQYWRDETTTKGAIIDGWFHSGDLGRWHDTMLGLLDRKEQMATLDSGDPVSPARVERSLRRSPVVADAVAVAADRPSVTALLQPAFETLLAWARQEGIPMTDVKRDETGTVVGVDRDSLDTAPVHDRFEQAVASANDQLAEHETVEAIHVLDRCLRLDEDELTPLLETRRNRIEQQFAEEIDALYE
jgi:long-chain acyl-CoA synthetase